MQSWTRVFVLVSLVAIASPALAETTNASVEQTPSNSTVSTENLGWKSWGVRVGVTDDSDQIVGGAHFNLGEPIQHVRFQPDVQLGSGDDHTTIYGTVPLYYRFNLASRMTPYAGGGLALGYVDVDLPDNSNGDDSSFELGGRATGGLEWARAGDQAFFVELSLGFGDIHDATVMAAWTF